MNPCRVYTFKSRKHCRIFSRVATIANMPLKLEQLAIIFSLYTYFYYNHHLYSSEPKTTTKLSKVSGRSEGWSGHTHNNIEHLLFQQLITYIRTVHSNTASPLTTKSHSMVKSRALNSLCQVQNNAQLYSAAGLTFR